MRTFRVTIEVVSPVARSIEVRQVDAYNANDACFYVAASYKRAIATHIIEVVVI